jgi:hypothetical protein
MTDIDRAADVEIARGFAQVTVRIPLIGHVSQEWLSFYNMLAQKWLAREQNVARPGRPVPLEANDLPDRSWIVVRLPASTDHAQVQSVLNAAHELITEVDAAEQAPQAAETEAIFREWWARQQR